MPTFKENLQAAVLALPTASRTRFINGYAGYWDYQTDIPGPDGVTLIPNPETKVEFVERVLIRSGFIEPVRSYEKKVAEQAAVSGVIIADLPTE